MSAAANHRDEGQPRRREAPARQHSPGRQVRATSTTRFALGAVTFRGGARSGQSFSLDWDSHQVLNGHCIVAGGTGSGKTHQLRRIVGELGAGGIRCHLIDVHGDIVPEIRHDTVKFSEATAFGLNPLEVSPDPDFGGPRKRANAFIGLMLRQSSLGAKQSAALFRVLIDLYRRYGFETDDARSWSLAYDPRNWANAPKRHPTLSDLRKEIWARLVAMKLTGGPSAARKLEEVMRLQRRLYGLRLKNLRGDEVEAKLALAKDAVMSAMADALDKLDSGDELEELIAWDSADSVKGLYDRLESLERAGIFKGRPPDFDEAAPVWRYDLKSLSREEAQFFVDCLCGQIFAAAKQRGEADGPDTAIVIDEAAIFLDPKDPDHILSIIAREARKFGVMLVLASQDLSNFPQDVIGASATKMLLGIDEMFHAATERRLGLDAGKLKFIRPHETALIQLKTKGKGEGLVNRFWEAVLCG